jgi:hypothetical protein
MKKITDFITRDIAFAIILLGGRFPLWGLFYLYLTQAIPLTSLICLGINVIFLRGLLSAREENRSPALGALSSFYKYIFRPLGYLIFIEVVYLALTYLFLFGEKADWVIFLAAFACYIVYYAAMVLPEKKKKSADADYILPRDAKFHTVVFLLWLYAFLHPDGLYMLLASLTFIYILEFLSTLKVDLDKGVLLRRVNS